MDTSERRGGTHLGIPERINAISTWIQLFQVSLQVSSFKRSDVITPPLFPWNYTGVSSNTEYTTRLQIPFQSVSHLNNEYPSSILPGFLFISMYLPSRSPRSSSKRLSFLSTEQTHCLYTHVLLTSCSPDVILCG